MLPFHGIHTFITYYVSGFDVGDNTSNNDLFFQMEHERLWDWQRFTQAQLKVVNQQWQRDREELLSRALVTLQDARYAHQEELELHRDRQHQQDICSNLREKVSIYLTLPLKHVTGVLMFQEHFQLFSCPYYVGC